jgi:CxxC motif-containing protein (DUF1111 family)
VAVAADHRPAVSQVLEGPSAPVRPKAVAVAPADGPVRSVGAEIFARSWLANDTRCHGGDGLGPVYNAASCLDCHNQGGAGGGGPADRNVELATGIGYMASPDGQVVVNGNVVAGNIGLDMISTNPEPDDLVRSHPGFRNARSIVLHRFGVDLDYSRWRETFLTQCRQAPHFQSVSVSRSASIGRSRHGHAIIRHSSPVEAPNTTSTPPIPPALAKDLSALCRDVAGNLGMNRVAFSLTARNTPPLFGAGLIDAVSDAELERMARHEPPQVRGRVHRLNDGRIGRFGWKAQVASLEDFVLTACANELGLQVPGHDQAASPLAPDARAAGPDLTTEECAALVSYVRDLPPPVALAAADARGSADIEEGHRLFQSVGCVSCHTPDLGPIRGIYSDLLLHDMGENLSDPGTYYGDDSDSLGAAKRGEWRTPPLWGIKDSGPYLHDGQARSLAQAVTLHDGQGAASAHRFRSLGPVQQSQILAFLNSLVAPAAAPAPQILEPAGGAPRSATSPRS